jgi:hypothetical protein
MVYIIHKQYKKKTYTDSLPLKKTAYFHKNERQHKQYNSRVNEMLIVN